MVIVAPTVPTIQLSPGNVWFVILRGPSSLTLGGSDDDGRGGWSGARIRSTAAAPATAGRRAGPRPQPGGDPLHPRRRRRPGRTAVHAGDAAVRRPGVPGPGPGAQDLRHRH